MVSLPKQTHTTCNLLLQCLLGISEKKRPEMVRKVLGLEEVDKNQVKQTHTGSSMSGWGAVSQQRSGGAVTTGSGERDTKPTGLRGNRVIHIVCPLTGGTCPSCPLTYKGKWWTRLVGKKSHQEHREMNKLHQKQV